MTEAKPDFLATVRKRYQRCVEADRENRERALEALRFRNLEQWDEKVKKDREQDPEGARPCLVLDKLNQHVNQVVNDERQNRPQIKVRPVDDKADPETAKILDGIVRHIQDQSRADIAYDTGFEHAVDGGFGYWRLLTEYCDEHSFDQDIRIKRVRNRFAVYLDPDHQEPDGSDSKFGFVIEKYTKDDFEKDFPEAKVESFDTTNSEFAEWIGKDWILVAEHFWVEPKKVMLCMLADAEGTVMPEEVYKGTDAPAEAYEPSGDGASMVKKAIQKKRETTVNQVLWRKVTASQVIEPAGQGDVTAKDGDPAKLWAGKWIPIVEVIGNELDIEGKVFRAGMIRGAMDAQRVYNYAASSFTENVGLAPRAPWLAAEGQIEGHEDDWRSANRRNLSVLPYKPIDIDGTPVPPPMRQPPPGIPAGWQAVLINADQDIQASMGRYSASVGEPSNEKSGKAIMARNREGDVGTFHFQDNLARSILHTGRMLVDLIPKIYDTRRIARIIGEDGTPDHAIIDPELPVAYEERKTDDGRIERIYNPSIGKYDVTVNVGPSFTTRRQEAAEFLTAAVQGAKDPVTANVLTYLAMKSQDWAGSDEALAMLKKTLPPELVEPEEGEQDVIQTPQGPIPKDQAGQLIGQLSAKLEEVISSAELLKEKNRNLDLGQRGKELLQKDEEISLKRREVELKEKECADRATQMTAETARTTAETGSAENTAMLAAAMAQGVDLIAQAAAQLAAAASQIWQTQGAMAEAAVINAQAASAPRKIELVTDNRGLPIGAVSQVLQ